MIIYPQKPIKLSAGEYKYFSYGKIRTIEIRQTKIDGVYYCEELCLYFYDRHNDNVFLSKSQFNWYACIFDTISI